MVSLALLSSASPVCLTQFHTNCPHSTSHGESYRKRVQASSEAKSRKWPQEYRLYHKCDTCNKRYAHFWTHSFKVPSQETESIDVFFFIFKTRHFTYCLYWPFQFWDARFRNQSKSMQVVPIKKKQCLYTWWKAMFLPSSQFLTLKYSSHNNQMSTI